MDIRLVGNGTQYRAYCPACDIGLNWWADDAGRASAERYTAAHICDTNLQP